MDNLTGLGREGGASFSATAFLRDWKGDFLPTAFAMGFGGGI